MVPADLKKKVSADLEQYRALLTQHCGQNSRAMTELGGGTLQPSPGAHLERHLINIIRELEALLRDE
jgi:hypothetical protein